MYLAYFKGRVIDLHYTEINGKGPFTMAEENDSKEGAIQVDCNGGPILRGAESPATSANEAGTPYSRTCKTFMGLGKEADHKNLYHESRYSL